MLINLSSFCWKSKTKFWSRKTSGREGLSEHRSYETETILLNHKLGECGGGADQTIRPVCTRWRWLFGHCHRPPNRTFCIYCLDGKDGEAQEDGKRLQRPPSKGLPDACASIWAQKCQRDWIHWFSTSGGRSVLSYNQGCSGKWALFILLWSFIYSSFSRIDEHRHTVKTHLQTAPNRCNRDSLQAPRSTHTNKFERAGPEQTALNHKFCTLRKHRGYHRRWSITWVK